jgi:hypothetical protein
MNIKIDEVYELLFLREALATLRGQVMYSLTEIKSQCGDDPGEKTQIVLEGLQRKLDAIDKMYQQTEDILKEITENE